MILFLSSYFFFKVTSGAIIVAAIVQSERLHNAKQFTLQELYWQTTFKQNKVMMIIPINIFLVYS